MGGPAASSLSIAAGCTAGPGLGVQLGVHLGVPGWTSGMERPAFLLQLGVLFNSHAVQIDFLVQS